MTLGDMLQFIKAQVRTAQGVDDLLKSQINIAYRSMAKGALWNELRVDNEEITTVADTNAYFVPYPLESVIEESVRYDVTETEPGYPIPLKVGGNEAIAAGWGTDYRTVPLLCGLTSGTGEALDNVGTITASNQSAAVTGNSTTWTSALEGQWMIFRGGSTGSDYAYQIDTVGGATSITLTETYRGAALSSVAYEIRPATSMRLLFLPGITESDKTITYSWQRKPRRLYNDEDIPEVTQLSEAICYQAMSMLGGSYLHDRADREDFRSEARRLRNLALINSARM